MRRFCLDHDSFLFYRMNKLNPPRMQVNGTIRIGSWKAIFQVTFYRAADMRKLRPDLMVAAGEQFNFEQVKVVAAFDDPVNQFCPLCPFSFRRNHQGFIHFLIPEKVMNEMCRWFGRRMLNNRPVGLFYFMLFQHFIQSGQRLRCSGEEDIPAYRPVNPVDDAKIDGSRFAIFFGEIVFQEIR